MKNISEVLKDVKTVGIGGHVRPDGDCVGSCMALYLYIRNYFPDVDVSVYLDHPKPIFGHIDRIGDIKTEVEEGREFDLFITCDVSARDRLAVAGAAFDHAKKTVCIDHHISNPEFADINYVKGDISSCCEVLYGLLDPEKVDRPIATAVYTGMIHDTGVFQYSCTSSKTMEIAGQLMDKGIDYSRIVDDTFYIRTFAQQQILGKALMDAELHFNGTCISSVVKRKQLEKFHVEPKDLDGIVSTLRSTAGVEAAVFVSPNENDTYKVSLRSASYMDVAPIAMEFGGGGHSRAAGVSMEGKPDEILKKVLAKMKKQLKDKDTEEDGCTTES